MGLLWWVSNRLGFKSAVWFLIGGLGGGCGGRCLCVCVCVCGSVDGFVCVVLCDELVLEVEGG